ncbi:hypothetical protein HDU93_003075, partial [Gonapodya sp. JEL0774]
QIAGTILNGQSFVWKPPIEAFRDPEQLPALWVPLEVLLDTSPETPLRGTIQRVGDRVAIDVTIDQYNPLYVPSKIDRLNVQELNLASRQLQTGTVIHFTFPDVRLAATSEAFTTIFDVCSRLIIAYAEPKEKERADRMREWVLLLQRMDMLGILSTIVHDIEDLQMGITEKELQVKELLQERPSDPSIESIGASMAKSKEDLFYVLSALKTMRERKKTMAATLQINCIVDTLNWVMLADDGVAFADAQLTGTKLLFVQNEDGSTILNVNVEDVLIQNLASTFPGFRNAVSRFIPAGSKDSSKQKSLRIQRRSLAPVGGIPIVEHLELDVHPFSVRITLDLARRIRDYIFPIRKTSASAKSSSSTNLALQGSSNTSEGSEIDQMK